MKTALACADFLGNFSNIPRRFAKFLPKGPSHGQSINTIINGRMVIGMAMGALVLQKNLFFPMISGPLFDLYIGAPSRRWLGLFFAPNAQAGRGRPWGLYPGGLPPHSRAHFPASSRGPPEPLWRVRVSGLFPLAPSSKNLPPSSAGLVLFHKGPTGTRGLLQRLWCRSGV